MTFEILISIASAISLGLSIFATVKVVSIQNSLRISNSDSRKMNVGSQTIIGSGNRQGGGDVNA